MAHFGVLHLYTPLLISHRKFTVDKCNTPRSHGLYITYHIYTTSSGMLMRNIPLYYGYSKVPLRIFTLHIAWVISWEHMALMPKIQYALTYYIEGHGMLNCGFWFTGAQCSCKVLTKFVQSLIQ